MNASINTSLIPSLNTKQQAANTAAARADGMDFPPAAQPSPAAATILESVGIKVTLDKNEGKEHNNLVVNELNEKSDNKDFYKCISLKCKSLFCETCRISRGLQIRDNILAKAHLFKVPKLYTLTVNREWFDSPQAAYEYVMGKKFISRLLTTNLKVKRWFWVLEPQEANGDGWPHWHLLIDVGDLPGVWYHKETKSTSDSKPENAKGWFKIPNFFDLNKVHRLLVKWKIGKQCKLTQRKDKFNNPVHAIRYITKYLIKMPRRGFPLWMWDTPGLRFYQPSHKLGTLGGVTEEKKDEVEEDAENEDAENEDTEKEEKPRNTKKKIDRVSECKKQVIFINYDYELDRHLVTTPVFAVKESIQYCPGAVCHEDFDFKTLKKFIVWGFEKLNDMDNFFKMWLKWELQEPLQAQIKAKKKWLLEQWVNTAEKTFLI